ncbi:nucleotide sugar dehydrogenase [Vagococcus fluvialis]|uniref:nucleotide sugar dehydrogenase n=1 Tax=Vagococcus fluvialis TaxID=2738 RepID=UPI002B30BC32|nr:nucleotide sugar dehydrogenase [Vagococcus fluvialis]
MEKLIGKLKQKNAVLGVIGLGYVGLPLAVEKAKAGFKTIGFDVQNEKIIQVNEGVNYIGDVVNEDLSEVVRSGLLQATSDFSRVASADCVCICVPTPLDKHQQPDISYVKKSAESILPYLHKDMLIVLESTTYPGTTQELLLPIFESTGLICGKDFYLAFSPERVDPGNIKFKTKNTPKVVGGVTKNCTEVAGVLYEEILDAPVHKVSSPAVAEMEKILENTYRNVNIGLVNELAILSDKMGINFWEVVDAAKTKPYGFQAFYPGPGLGGHCIPLDPYYLSWKAREYGVHTSMIEASMVINDKMPEYCVMRASKILNKFQKAISQSKILILGIAYKQDIDDYRESPALSIIEELECEGAEVSFYDSFISEYKNKGTLKRGLSSIDENILQEFDLVIITTSHTSVDYSFIQQNSRMIFDTKNATKNVANKENIELL